MSPSSHPTQASSNPFPYSDTNKRYHTWDYHLKHTFGGKTFKVSLNAGFGCPNRDGTKGFGGCTYCSASGSGDFAGNPQEDMVTQFEKIRNAMLQKWPDATRYIGYFQAGTNTYAPLAALREKYEAVLAQPGVVGLSIATRADCLPEDVVEYLAQLNRKTYLMVELGLQSVSDETGQRIHRGHTYQEFLDGFWKLHQQGIRVCVHIINGLPGENRERMLETVQELSHLPLYAIKIHLLHVLRGTAMAEEYARGEFSLMTREEYISVVCDQLEMLPPSVVIQRLTGDGDRQMLIGPLWSLKKLVVINEIDKELFRRGSWQGKRYDGVLLPSPSPDLSKISGEKG